MKKYLIKFFVATFFLLSHTKSWAQIVLDLTDLPAIGDIEIYKKLDSSQSSTVLPGPSGANQVWNFSSLPANPLDTNFYVAPSATPNGSSFPNANIAIKYFDVQQYNYDYCINGPGGMKINGFVFGNPANIIVFDIDPFKFPILTFGNSINHNLRAKFNIVNSSTYDAIFISFTSTADAWGTITTPAGTINAIRIHTTEISYDSSYVNGVGTQTGTGTGFYYQWYAKGLGWPVLQIAKGKLAEPDYKTVKYANTLNGGSSSQNVGIGTTTPTEKLDVFGNINVSGSIKAVGLEINGNINITQTIKANGVAGTSGQVLGANSSGNLTWLNVPVGGFSNFQVFNSSGTFTVPSGITKVMVEVWGAGGAGSSTNSGSFGGSGGGGGGYGKGIFSVLPATQFTVTVGAGGTGVGSGSGNAGGTSSFDVLISASGGGGGPFGGCCGLGGSSSGAFSVAGGTGGGGGNNAPPGSGGAASGGGGSGHPGGGGQGNAPGGAGSGTGVPATAGGNGASGRVVVWW